jgi:hypothetical protein
LNNGIPTQATKRFGAVYRFIHREIFLAALLDVILPPHIKAVTLKPPRAANMKVSG